ncbi:PEP/pyruvate-binding domain-containing protein [Nonomuraea aurantiaca]|uniref:PEP/pyruvate-binding domain-containing protein n=1 Tax=Nonomuraea aurantiaca TaxID=2878562 RepID=UPI001CD9A3D5|nr:PEP/pyruvate-binding domain-containing protein [Nonomuraea aurantiaca]MCA2221678.1 phosphoenolpyruvate synthase [Nonomuraea aurantiaca]
MRLVAPLNAFGRGDLALAGGKGANLGELVKNGFPVPGGFVVTTAAYELVADGHDTRTYFENVEIPPELREAIAGAYAELGGGPVAVRSSATAEDLPGAAFAGQQDTYLNIVGEEAVVDAVRRCWGSLWTERAVAYREKRGVDAAEVRIAVVVQRMVQSEAAGVLFTANPVTGDRAQIVVDASTGLGEAVVSGLVTPDHYVLDVSGRVTSFTPGRREVVIRGTAGGGVVHETGDSATGEALPRAALAELARLASEVAARFGRPQDIEWAYAGGRVSLVQARPMTALPPAPVGSLNPVQRKVGSVLLEYLPVRPYPIDMTTWLPYGPAGMMAKVAAAFGIKGVFEDFLQEEDGVVYRLVPRSPRVTAGLMAIPFRLVRRARRYDPARWTEDPRFQTFLAANRELAARDMGSMPWPELIRVPRQALDLVQPVTDLRTDYLPGTGLALLRLLMAVKLLRRGALFGELMTGARTRTSDANQALEALAEEARATGALDADPMPSGFAAKLRDFFAEYGHRETVTPILVTPPTWGEAPEIVLGTIRVLASKPPTPAPAVDGVAVGVGGAVERLLRHPLLRAGRRRARVVRWVEAARAGHAFREDSHFYFTLPLPILRRSLLEIGARLRDAAVLQRPEDVFHLRLEELESIKDLAASDECLDELRAAVQQRAAKREELSGVRLIDPRAIFPVRDAGTAIVTGTPAGGGSATGPVKVIRDPAEFGSLTSGDVLVCPYTNPSWTPLFQRAAAVVVDTGSAASHAAIVAREYGIPAVMGTAGGTSTLVDGQVVTVDGDAGTVVIAHSSGDAAASDPGGDAAAAVSDGGVVAPVSDDGAGTVTAAS